MNEDGDYMDGYNDGFIDGRGTMLKPLRWRSGPVPGEKLKDEFLVKDRFSIKHEVVDGDVVLRGEKYIPLSEILALVEEE